MARVTRADLKGFDRTAQDLILDAQAQGARIRVSNRGHALVYGPDGESSTAVPRKMKNRNRAHQNTMAALKRMFKEDE